MTTTLDPALTVPCPTCRVGSGQPCRSRRAVSLHQARREALADLGTQAGQLLSAGRQKPEPRKLERAGSARPVPVVVGKTGTGNVIPPDEDWPPREKAPASVGVRG